MKTWCMVVLLLFGLAWAGDGRAQCVDWQSNPEYSRLGMAMNAAAAAEDYQTALELLEAMTVICRLDPLIWYSMGSIHHKRGDCEQALTLFDQAGRELVAATELGLVNWLIDQTRIDAKRLSVEQECLDSGGLNVVDVSCANEDVRLTLAEHDCRCPCSITLSPGSHELTASKPLYQNRKLSFVVAAGQSQQLVVSELVPSGVKVSLRCLLRETGVTLRSESSGVDFALNCGETSEPMELGRYTLLVNGEAREQVNLDEAGIRELVLALPPKPSEQAPQADSNASSSLTTWSWVLLGGGLGVLVTGGVLQGLAMSKANEVERGWDWQRALDTHDEAVLLSTLGLTSLALGAALAATGVVLLLAVDTPNDMQVGWSPTGLSLHLRF